MRIKILRLAVGVPLLIIWSGLFYIQALRGSYFHNLSVNNRIRIVPLEGQRGLIRDSHGVTLADNRLTFDIVVIPQDIRDKELLFNFLSDVLSIPKKKLLQLFWQRKLAPFAPVVVAEDISKSTAMIIEENKYRFPGLYVQESFRRWYPFRAVGAHVVGYLGKIDQADEEKMQAYGYTQQSLIGKTGVEAYYDSFLHGKGGGLQIEVNSRGEQVQLLGIREPERGDDIQLTIDYRIQKSAAQILGDKPGAIIVMNLGNGAILGQVSSPTYDPNIFVDSRVTQDEISVLTNPNAPLLNRAIKGLYPPGSVFKTIVTIAALDLGKISTYTSFLCKGYYQLGRRQFGCSHTHGTQNLIQAIAHSCNVYFFNVGDLLGPDVMNKYANLFGLGSLTHIDLPFEEKGMVPGRLQRKLKRGEGWYKGDTLNYSIGQGDLLVTPLQLLCMMATVARNGDEVQPHLIEKIGSQEIINLATVRHVAAKPEAYKIVQTGLQAAVEDNEGTAHLLNDLGLGIWGKTGTAQAGQGKEHHSWFVGYNTKGKNKIVFCVFLEHGGASYNACVLAKQLLDDLVGQEIL